jgi:hypothetical protein
MVEIPKGGRGHKAPYETATMRVPIPLHNRVEKLIEEYRSAVLTGNPTDTLTNSSSTSEQVITREEVTSKLEALAKSKKKGKDFYKHIVEYLFEPQNGGI